MKKVFYKTRIILWEIILIIKQKKINKKQKKNNMLWS